MKNPWSRWLKTLAVLPITALLMGGMTPIANATTVQSPQVAVAPTEITDPELVAPEDYQLTLSTEGNEQFFDYPFSAPIIYAKLNYSFNTDEYRIFIVDMTTQDVVGVSGAVDDEGSAIRPGFDFGNPHEYQAFYSRYTANDYPDVTKFSELIDIKAYSNKITLSRSPWSVEIAPLGEDDVDVITTHGGGAYNTYLVDDRTNKVIWNEFEQGEPLFAPNPYHIEDVEWATAYVARDFRIQAGADGIKPLVKADLKDIQATSRKYRKPTGAGTGSTYEIAGGSNPSVPCAQGCEGDPINMATGEFFLSEKDLSVPGVGLTVGVNRSYSITNKGVLGPLGYGWSTGSTMSITSPNAIPNLLNNDTLTVNQENGSIVDFSKNPDGSYETGSAVQADLTYNATTSEFVFKRGETSPFVFNNAGKLVKKQDQYGNSIVYTYAGSNVAIETDSNGNTLSYTYTNGLLTKVTDNNGQVVTYGYNVAKKLLTSVTNSNGVVFLYTYDTSGRMKTLTNALGGITTNTYDAQNRVTQQKDPLGGLLKFAYAGELLNQTVTITQPDNSKSSETYQHGQLTQKVLNPGTAQSRTWSYYYGTTNQVISAIAPDGSVANVSYDVKGNMLSSVDAKGLKTTFTYNDQNKILTSTDALGHVSTNTYDSKGNILTSTNAIGGVTTFVYNADSTLSKVTDPRGNAIDANPADYTTTFAYGAKGLVTETTDSLGNKTQNSYDALGRMTSTVDPRGNTSAVSYNALNLPSKVTDPLLNETVLTYDNMGNGLTSKDASGSVITYTYDLMGNLLTSKDALNQTTTYVYDKRGRVTSITDAKGKVSSIKYDNSGRVIETTDALLQVTKNEWDVRDNLVASIDANGSRMTYTYDKNGNVLTAKTPLGSVSSYAYDTLNRVVKTTDAENRVTKMEYDALGRVIKTVNPDNSFVTSGYDPIGNIVTTTDAAGKSSHYEYDTLSRKVKYTDEMGAIETYSYNANSNLETKTRVDGSLVSYVYDKRSALTKVDYPGSNADVVYTYNNLGQKVTEQKGSESIVSYAYDAIGQLKSRGPPASKVSYEYDAVGNQTKLTYPSGRVVDYAYNDNSQIKTLVTSGIDNVSYAYDTRGNNITTSLPNLVLQSRIYDADNQLSKKSLTKDVSILFEHSLGYNNAGEMTQQGKTGSSVVAPTLSDYTYDPLSRISIGKNHNTGAVENNYVHDSVGNLTTNNGITQTFDDAGRLLSSGTKNLTYDARGNRLVDTVTTSTWDVDNTLSNVQKGTNNIAYTYDANGLLQTRKLDSNVTNTFTWDMSSSIPLLLNDGEFEYIYGDNRIPVAQIKVATGAVSYLVADTNGSVTALLDASGSVSTQMAYTPYGVRTGTLDTNLGYAGEWTDKITGNTYHRARWYDANTSVFLSVDPLTQATGQAYGYTSGNPLQQIDPLGLCSLGGLFHIGSDCYSFADSNWFQNVSDTSAAFGDSASFGGTDAIRELAGVNSVVNKCSGYYTAGGIAGDVATIFIPGGGILKAGKAGGTIIAKAGGTTTKQSFKGFWKDFKQIRKDESGEVGLPLSAKIKGKPGNFAGKIERVNVGNNRGVTDETLNAIVKHNGLSRTSSKAHGETIFQDAKGKMYYARDYDSHNGGVFKGAKTKEDFTPSRRKGTYDENLKKVGK